MQIPRDIEGTALGLLLAFDTIEVYRQRRAVHLETVLAAAYMVGELKSVCSVCDCPASIGNRTQDAAYTGLNRVENYLRVTQKS